MQDNKIKTTEAKFMHKYETYDASWKIPEEIYRDKELKSLIKEAFKTLSARESKVLIMRFGLEDGKERTLKEVGKTLILSPERIRQIQALALRKLKHPSRSRIIIKYLEQFPKELEIKDKDIEKIADLPVDFHIELVSSNIYEKMIQYFSNHPEEMKTLDRRKFEEMIAELFNGFGYIVELTKQTRDGGIDIIAIKHSEVSVKNLIECKRPEPRSSVGISPVRELYAVKCDKKATKAILATTTFFSRPAKIFFSRHEWELEPRDYYGIIEWINDYLKIRGK